MNHENCCFYPGHPGSVFSVKVQITKAMIHLKLLKINMTVLALQVWLTFKYYRRCDKAIYLLADTQLTVLPAALDELPHSHRLHTCCLADLNTAHNERI